MSEEDAVQEQIEITRRLYDAFLAHDAAAILAELHPEFVGIVSDGMPLGWGGRHNGPEGMMAEVWGPVFARYDVRVELEEMLPSGETMVAVGVYRGRARESGAGFEAAFVHLLGFRDGRIATLRQITDSASWPAPG